MFIKLTNALFDRKALYLNVNAISSVAASDRRDDDGSRVYITGEDSPWYVSETVYEVIDRINAAEVTGKSQWESEGE